jgi:hypothetical protein
MKVCMKEMEVKMEYQNTLQREITSLLTHTHMIVIEFVTYLFNTSHATIYLSTHNIYDDRE